MQNNRQIRALFLALLMAGPPAACVKEISSEERLERATADLAVKEAIGPAELAKVSCENTSADLQKARNESRPETERVLSYMSLYESLKKRTATFDEAMSRNPDLAYQEGSQQLVAAKDLCVQQTADVKVEFERYIRELVEVPTVQEIKGGSTVTVARLDFGALRQAIDALAPDDRDLLLNRVTMAEKKIEQKAEAKPKRGR